MNEYIELGSITSCFGVKGLVKLYSHTRPRIGIASYNQFYFGEGKQSIIFGDIKSSGKYIIAKIADVDSREEAAPYVGQKLFVKHDELPKLDNEYYWRDLIGLSVINQDGLLFGKVTELMETGANDVMIIKNESGQETLIPFILSHFVSTVDIEKGEMHVVWESDDE